MSINLDFFIEKSVKHALTEYDFQKKGGCIVFNKDGSVCFFTESIPTVLNMKPEAILGKPIRELIKSDKDYFDILDEYKTVSLTVILNNKAINVIVSSPSSLGGEYGFMILHDKTALQDYVYDLKNYVLQLKNLVNNFRIGFVLLDDDHQVMEVNQSFCDNLGYTIEEALKLKAWDYIYDFEEKGRFNKIELNHTYYFGRDNYHIRKDGSTIPIKGYCTVTKINDKRIAMCFYENITEIRDSSIRLEQSETMLNNFITNSTDVVIVLDTDLSVRYISPNTKQVFNYTKSISKNELIEKYLPVSNPDFMAFIKENLNRSESKKEFEYTIKYKNKVRYFSVRTSTVNVDEEMIICYIRDVTKDKEYIEELKILTYTDQLTELYNRHFMEEQLFELRKPENFPISIISGDLDGLKEVNDTLGHQAGDELLRRFAKILTDTHTISEEIFRIGGDEFLIIATHTDENKADKIIKKINEGIEKHNSHPSSSLKISASIGYSTSAKMITNLSAMLALADKEMYIIKNSKKANKLF